MAAGETLGNLGETNSDPVVAAIDQGRTWAGKLEMLNRLSLLDEALLETGRGGEPADRYKMLAGCRQLMRELEIDPEDPRCWRFAAELKASIVERTSSPFPFFAVPEIAWFERQSSKLQRIQRDSPHCDVRLHEPAALDVVRYGYLRYGTSPDTKSQALQLRGVARVVCDPAAYQVRCPEAIRLHSDGRVQSGRLRALTLIALGPAFVAEAQLERWVRVDLVKTD